MSEAGAIAFGPELRPVAAARGQIVVTAFRACDDLARTFHIRDRAAKRTTVKALPALSEYLQETMLNLSISLPFVRRQSRAQVQPVETVRKPSSEAETKRKMTMRFMILVKAGKNTEAGVLPSKELRSAKYPVRPWIDLVRSFS